ncbi:MAG: hypothetical protein Q8Q36_02590 [bacterium]|nr:hypothetical protein [bacterium]
MCFTFKPTGKNAIREDEIKEWSGKRIEERRAQRRAAAEKELREIEAGCLVLNCFAFFTPYGVPIDEEALPVSFVGGSRKQLFSKFDEATFRRGAGAETHCPKRPKFRRIPTIWAL